MRKQMNVILLGDPAQGGFRGVNYCGSNNDLAWGQSPNMYNYLVSNTGLTKRKGCATLNSIQAQVGTATFSRPSIAYKLDGTQVAVDAPRYETGKFGQAMMMEMGTTNYLTAPRDFANTIWTKTNLTVTADATTALNGLQEADKLAPTVINGNVSQSYSIDPAWKWFMFTVWLKADVPHYARIGIQNNDNTEYVDKQIYVTTTWQRFEVAKRFSITGKTGVCVYIWPGDYNGTIDYVYAWGAQLEINGSNYYVTSFTEGTRSPEILTCPSSLLNSQEGTIECWVKLLYRSQGLHLYLFDGAGATNQNLIVYVIYKDISTDKLVMKYGTGTTTVTLEGITGLIPNTWYHVAFRWSSAGVALLLNGAVEVSSTTAPSLTFGTNIYLGSRATGFNQLNGLIDDVRISSLARTNQEIMNTYQCTSSPAPLNTSISAYYGFDNDLIGTSIAVNLPVTGLYRHYNGSVYKTFAKCSTNIYEVPTSGIATSRLSGLNADVQVFFESWMGLCFCVDGINLYKASTGDFSTITWLDENGASTTGWTLLPTPVVLVLHKNHLWWFDKNSSRVGFTVRNYYDRVFEDPLNAGKYGSWVSCDQDDGQHLTALIRVPLADCLMAFKRQKSFLITGDFDLVSDTIAVIPGPPTGAYSQTCVVACPDGFVRWYGPDGIWQYRQDTGPICISRNKELQLDIDAELQKILSQNRSKCCMGYWDHYLLFFYPYGTSTYNDRCLAFDTVKMEWMPIRAWNVSRLCVFEDNTLYAGWSNAGYVKRLFINDNDDGLPISCYYETKYYGQSQIEQVLDSIRGKITAGRSLTFGWRSDATSNSSGMITFSFGPEFISLGNRENPGLPNTFKLGDRNNPGYGTTLSNRDAKIIVDFARRLVAGQRFREMQFFFSESSTSAHSLDFIEVHTYPRRMVI